MFKRQHGLQRKAKGEERKEIGMQKRRKATLKNVSLFKTNCDIKLELFIIRFIYAHAPWTRFLKSLKITGVELWRGEGNTKQNLVHFERKIKNFL